MMEYTDFYKAIRHEIDNALTELHDKRNVLDLRASRSPYDVWDDNEVFATSEIREAYDFIKDAEEWYVDIYENFVGENYAEFTDFAVASWTNN